jgi:hypothetical protein
MAVFRRDEFDRLDLEFAGEGAPLSCHDAETP